MRCLIGCLKSVKILCFTHLFRFTSSTIQALTAITLPSATTSTASTIFALLYSVFSHELLFRRLYVGSGFLITRRPRMLLWSGAFALWFSITTFRAWGYGFAHAG